MDLPLVKVCVFVEKTIPAIFLKICSLRSSRGITEYHDLNPTISNCYPTKIRVKGETVIECGYTVNLLWICVVTASPSVVTRQLTALWVMTSDGVRKQNSADHSWHYHHKHGKNFQKSCKNGSCSCLDVVFGT